MENVPVPPPLDINRARKITRGDEELFTMLLKHLVTEDRASLDKVLSLNSPENHDTVRREAHRLKSALRSLGADTAASLAESLESAAGQGWIEEITVFGRKLLEEMDRIENYYRKNSETNHFAIRRVQALGEKRVLVVDDQGINRNFIKAYLVTKGFTVQTAENGLEAKNLTDHQKFELVFTDIEMPIMNGLEFLAAFRKNSSNDGTPVIVLSTVEKPEIIDRALKIGAAHYMVKPFTVEKMDEALKKIGV